jgi:hypothetical protein
MKEVVFLLEEESAKVLLENLFRRIVSDANNPVARFIVFEGKQDLEKQIPRKIASYINPDARFIIMRDQDQGDCKKIKRSLTKLCPAVRRPKTKVRIACRELEAFYLGDLRAVEAGLGVKGLGARQEQAKYRDPDKLSSPSRELERLSGMRYQKVSGSRAIAPHMSIVSPRSKSFFHLLQAIRNAAQ